MQLAARPRTPSRDLSTAHPAPESLQCLRHHHIRQAEQLKTCRMATRCSAGHLAHPDRSCTTSPSKTPGAAMACSPQVHLTYTWCLARCASQPVTKVNTLLTWSTIRHYPAATPQLLTPQPEPCRSTQLHHFCLAEQPLTTWGGHPTCGAQLTNSSIRAV